MKKYKAKQESYFDINLAPMLDVIVAIVPMLLMSVVFLKVNMIEAQIPQIVAQAIEDNKNKPQPVTVALSLNIKGYKFEITENGKKRDIVIGSVNGKPDLDRLYTEALQIKRRYPDIFKVEVKPEKDVSLEGIVVVLDNIRESKTADGEFTVKDPKTGTTANTKLMFPEVVFSGVLEGA